MLGSTGPGAGSAAGGSVVAMAIGDLVGVLLVLVFIGATFVLSRKFGTGLVRRANKKDVLVRGEAATAVLVSMAETGTTINQQPMVAFELDVTRAGAADAYRAEVKQILPRLLLGQVRPGMTLGVKVMPDDPGRVGIDWSSLNGVDDAGAGGTGPSSSGAAGGVVDTNSFLERCEPAVADIEQMGETGQTVPHSGTGEMCPVYSFELTVRRPGKKPYEAKLLQGVPREWRGRFGPGATVPIGVLPDDPGDVAIDWRRMEGTAQASEA